MAKFQYIAEGHTLVQTTKAAKEKVKVVTGEIIDIEDGIFTDGRLMMAGFQKIIDGIEDVVEAAGNLVEDIKDAITGNETAEKTEETEENSPKTSETEAEDLTPAEDAENAPEATQEEETPAPEAPTVEITTEDDGKDEITIEIAPAAAEPVKKEAAKKK